MELGPDDNILCTLPLFHTAATHMAFGGAVAAGGCFIIAERFSREGFWPLARRAHATATYLFPAQIAILISAPPSPSYRTHRIRICFSHVRNQPFCDRFGVDVRPGWAMTDTSGMVPFRIDEQEAAQRLLDGAAALTRPAAVNSVTGSGPR